MPRFSLPHPLLCLQLRLLPLLPGEGPRQVAGDVHCTLEDARVGAPVLPVEGADLETGKGIRGEEVDEEHRDANKLLPLVPLRVPFKCLCLKRTQQGL